MGATPDPYTLLGIPPTSSDAEVRAAYRRLVQLHHPDHNGGSAESERRFEEVQEAYAEVRRRRAAQAPRSQPQRPGEDDIASRLAAMEQELRAARDEAARRAREAGAQAREAAAAARRTAEARIRDRSAGAPGRPSDEELGYFSTEDSFSKILSDAATEWSGRLDHAADEIRETPVTERLADLLDDLGSKLTGERRDRD
jgi:curved DNA-binding protein CbpA